MSLCNALNVSIHMAKKRNAPLTGVQKSLVQYVYDQFRATGEWPYVWKVETSLRRT